MSTNNPIFSGTSRCAQDFTQIIDRAVRIASLPISQLNNQKNALTDKSAALNDLTTQFASLHTAIDKLTSTFNLGSLKTTVSDTSIVRATTAAGAMPGDYQIEVISPGSQTQSLSLDGLPIVTDPYTQPISSAASFTLSVGGTAITISPAGNNLAALASAINAAGAGVTANIINIGSNSSPDYRLSLTCTQLGPVTVSLSDGSRELLNTLASGTVASYKVNGLPAAAISSTSRTVTIGLGVTLDLLKAGSTEVNVEQDPTALKDALTAFVTAYNATNAAVDKQNGKDAGPLQGDPVVSTLRSELRDLHQYAGTSTTGLNGLADLGIAVDKNGVLQFDTAKFQSVTAGGLQKVTDFFGSATTSGFLNAAATMLDHVENSTNGFLPTATSGIATQMTHQDQLIADNQNRVDLMRESLMSQMAKADALIASLEQQVTIFNGIFQAQLNANKN